MVAVERIRVQKRSDSKAELRQVRVGWELRRGEQRRDPECTPNAKRAEEEVARERVRADAAAAAG